MGHEIRGFAGTPNGPSNLASGYGQGVDQHPRAVADVLMFASLTPPRLGRFGRYFAFEDLHARFFIAADHQTALLIEGQRLGVQLTDGVGFGSKVLVVAMKPIRTFVRLKIDVVQDPPDA